ncbi:hypothetical protein [Leucobacter luti]|uniref:hypothetical protein n=1 Tax=Leucobacter luti TaxID=340320 RepID=UPI00105C78A4|nr:hypothetical protein [Leucobacter luti]
MTGEVVEIAPSSGDSRYALVGWWILTAFFLVILFGLSAFVSGLNKVDYFEGLDSVARSFGGSSDGKRFDTGPGFGFLGLIGAIVIALAVTLRFGSDWLVFSDRTQGVLTVVLVGGTLGTTLLAAATVLNVVLGRAGIVDGLLLLLGSYLVTIFGQLIAREPVASDVLRAANSRLEKLERVARDRGIPAEWPEQLPGRAVSEWAFWVAPIAGALLCTAPGLLTDEVAPRELSIVLLFSLGGVIFIQVAWRSRASYFSDALSDRVGGWYLVSLGVAILLLGYAYSVVFSALWLQRGFPLMLLVLAPILFPGVGTRSRVLRSIRERKSIHELERARVWRDKAAARIAGGVT